MVQRSEDAYTPMKLFLCCKNPFLDGTGHIACVQILKVVQKCFMPKPIINLVVFRTQGDHGINKVFSYGSFSVPNNSFLLGCHKMLN